MKVSDVELPLSYYVPYEIDPGTYADKTNWRVPRNLGSYTIDQVIGRHFISESAFAYALDKTIALEATIYDGKVDNPRRASWEQRIVLVEREEGRCFYCDEKSSNTTSLLRLNVDHYKPYSQGGLTVIANMVCCCYACNYAKSTMHGSDFLERVSEPDGTAWRDQRYAQHLSDFIKRNGHHPRDAK